MVRERRRGKNRWGQRRYIHGECSNGRNFCFLLLLCERESERGRGGRERVREGERGKRERGGEKDRESEGERNDFDY